MLALLLPRNNVRVHEEEDWLTSEQTCLLEGGGVPLLQALEQKGPRNSEVETMIAPKVTVLFKMSFPTLVSGAAEEVFWL